MRIAFLADPSSANGLYRAIGPMTALVQIRGHDVRQLWTEDGRVPAGAMSDLDVLFIHRYVDERAQQLVRSAKAIGAAVVWDEDDDIASAPKGSMAHARFGGAKAARRQAEVKQIMRAADLVTTPSPVIAERLLEQGAPRVEVIENHVPDYFREAAARPHAGVTIGWVAGGEHRLDVERLPIRETLQRLLDERPDVNVVSIGLRLGLRSERYQAIDVVPIPELAEHVAQFDIGIAPLADIAFNRARSNVKLKEYAAAGVPWLASPVGPYSGLGEREGGRLVGDDRWHEELVRLIDKPRERRKLAKHGAKWVAGETMERRVGVWETALAEAVEQARCISV